MKIHLQRLFFKLLGKTPLDMPMVQYWKHSASAQAKLMKAKDGSTNLWIEGEAEPMTAYPRGHLLFGSLSKLKHEIKNQVFNDSWWLLEQGNTPQMITYRFKNEVMPRIYDLAMRNRYDLVPPDKLSPAVREIHRAWTKVAPRHWQARDIVCLILQEDDSYRFRVQWLVTWFGWFAKLNPVKSFDYALMMLEHGEVIDDMKERQRLLRRILMELLKDPSIRGYFIAFFKEVDWNKVKLTKADKFHFRAKYFKVDLDKFNY